MGDENSILSAADARQLLRRSGFGARPDQVGEIEGMTRGAAVDDLLDFKPTKFRPGGRDTYRAHNSWVKYMVRKSAKRGKAGTRRGIGGRRYALQEKLVLFWHDHFATSDDKVFYTKAMANQNRLLRTHCKGNFRDFCKAINKDAAMIEYLDTERNGRFSPNENYARELQELFTLGVKDFLGNDNYSQEDIVQIATAFTGWNYRYSNLEVGFNDNNHALISDGPNVTKVIFTTHGNFGPGGASFANPEGETEIDQVIDILLQHTDTDTPPRNTTARHIAKKLFQYFTHADPDPAVIDAVIDDSNFDTAWDIEALLRAMFVHDAFYETGAAAPFDVNTAKSVRWPIDFVVGTMACFDMRFKGIDAYLDSQDSTSIYYLLENMGQHLFYPPSVFGWDWEASWVSSFTMLARYKFARSVITAREHNTRPYFRPAKVIDLVALQAVTQNAMPIVDAALNALGVPDQFDTAQKDALAVYITEPAAVTSHVDLTDEDVVDEKIRGLFLLILESPGYHLH